MIPYQDPTPTWPVGYRRAKTSTDWITQGIWAGATLAVGLAMLSSDFPVAGIFVIAVGLFTVVWVEFAARCESREKAWATWGGIMFLIALWAAYTRRHRN